MELLRYAFVVLGLAMSSSCLVQHAKETRLDGQGQTATTERSPAPTPAPELPSHRAWVRNALFARQEDDVVRCGYIDGNFSQPMGCGLGAGCCLYSATSTAGENWACCTDSGGSSLPGLSGISVFTGFHITSCLGYQDNNVPSAATANSIDRNNSLLLCASRNQECMTTRLSFSGSQYEGYDCGNSTSFALAFVVATNSPTTTTTSAIDSANSSVVPYTAPSDSKDTNVGAIAGGTVGGIAALALIGGIAGYLIWREKKAGKKQHVLEVETSQYGSTPQM